MLPRLFQVPLASAVGESAFMPQSREVLGLWHRVTGFRGKGLGFWASALRGAEFKLRDLRGQTGNM